MREERNSLGNLEPKRDFIHTYDMARAVRMLMEKFDSGIDVFNLGRGIEYSVVEIVQAFSRQLGEEGKNCAGSQENEEVGSFASAGRRVQAQKLYRLGTGMGIDEGSRP
jgi:nucleoside-diphosphate-sugar epimerase